MKIDRMLTIIVMLLNRNRISAKELAQKFEISVRTVYRDIDAINMAGIPIVSYAGNNGGFGILENYKIDHQVLTLSNMCSMLSALKGINSTLENKELESSIEKLRSLIPQDKAQHVDLHTEQIIIKMPWRYTAQQRDRLKVLQTAIAQSLLISITYRNFGGEMSERQVEPMSLVFKGYTWYLFAYCLLKTDFRMFRLSRIIDLDVQERQFKRKAKSYYDFEGESQKDFSLINMTLKFAPQVRTRVEDLFERADIEILSSGELIVTAPFPEEDYYLSLILSFGEQVEVLGPDKVRQAMALKVAAMQKKYQ